LIFGAGNEEVAEEDDYEHGNEEHKMHIPACTVGTCEHAASEQQQNNAQLNINEGSFCKIDTSGHAEDLCSKNNKKRLHQAASYVKL
jgi:hypothetical protein